MCTVSVIPRCSEDGSVVGLRLVSNRDESRERPPALAERWHELAGGVRAIWPVDPAGGGTWIAGTSRGLALTLLNVNLTPPVVGSVSRGGLIPLVADSENAAEAIARITKMDLRAYSSFRLVAADANDGLTVGEVRWDGSGCDVVWHQPGAVAFVSSGLGDRVVEPRLGVFERLCVVEPCPAKQDLFHSHRWDPLEHPLEEWAASVLMSRAGARTVSVTAVDIVGAEVSMSTEPVEETAEELAMVLEHSPDSAGFRPKQMARPRL